MTVPHGRLQAFFGSGVWRCSGGPAGITRGDGKAWIALDGGGCNTFVTPNPASNPNDQS